MIQIQDRPAFAVPLFLRDSEEKKAGTLRTDARTHTIPHDCGPYTQ